MEYHHQLVFRTKSTYFDGDTGAMSMLERLTAVAYFVLLAVLSRCLATMIQTATMQKPFFSIIIICCYYYYYNNE